MLGLTARRSRFPSALELLVQCLLALFLSWLAYDFWHAWHALPCSVRGAGAGCYPWGAEGPAASRWYYRSKDSYLWWSAIHFGVFAIAALSPFTAKGPASGLKSIFGILIVGYVILFLAGWVVR